MTVQDAEELCKLAHAGQFRKDGVTPYYTHPFAVASMMTTEEEKIVALLHDIIEDTSATIHQKACTNTINFNEVNYFISDKVCMALIAITKTKSTSYEEYLTFLGGDNLATKVKVADILHNISCNPSERARVKYYKGIKYLLSTL